LFNTGHENVTLSSTGSAAPQGLVGPHGLAPVVLRPSQMSRQNVEKVSSRSHRHGPQKRQRQTQGTFL